MFAGMTQQNQTNGCIKFSKNTGNGLQNKGHILFKEKHQSSSEKDINNPFKTHFIDAQRNCAQKYKGQTWKQLHNTQLKYTKWVCYNLTFWFL